MSKLTLVLGLMAVVLEAESSFYRIILPTYRPPPQPRQLIIRTARDTGRDEPLWLHSGDNVIRAPTTADHPVLPSIIDDVKFGPTRHARSLSTPGHGRIRSNDRGNGGSRGHDTEATHPGYNRRKARSLNFPDFVTTPPFNPKPWPGFPQPQKPRFPIYV